MTDCHRIWPLVVPQFVINGDYNIIFPIIPPCRIYDFNIKRSKHLNQSHTLEKKALKHRMIGFEISKRNNDLSYNLYHIYDINDATTCLKFQNVKKKALRF